MRFLEILEFVAGIFVEFVLALGWCFLVITVLSLAVVGFVTLMSWPIQDFLRFYTPLLLGLFSIGVTLFLFQKNLLEGRVRARKERDQGVRPILIAEAVDRQNKDYFGSGINFETKECCVTSASLNRFIYLRIENAGLGVALKIEIFIKCWNGEYYLVAHEIPRIAVNEDAYICIKCSLPAIVQAFVCCYRDVFDNTHFCEHVVCDDYDSFNQMIVGNEYRESFDKKELEKVEAAKRRFPLTREVFITHGYTVEGQLSRQFVNADSDTK